MNPVIEKLREVRYRYTGREKSITSESLWHKVSSLFLPEGSSIPLTGGFSTADNHHRPAVSKWKSPRFCIVLCV